MAAHKMHRLDVKGNTKKQDLQNGDLISDLRKLKNLDVLSASKLDDIENDLASLKVCYDLISMELEQSPICPHCRFTLDEKSNYVTGKLDTIENQLSNLREEWEKKLINTITDPGVIEQEKFLTEHQKEIVQDFRTAGHFPRIIDNYFVPSISAVLKNYQPVVINPLEFAEKLEALPPMDEESFAKAIYKLISEYTQGKNKAELRILIKR